MKKDINKSAIVLLLMLSMVCLFSCRKNEEEAPTPNQNNSNTNPNNNGSGNNPTPTGKLKFHLHTYIENNEVDAYNITYTTDAGRNISFSLAQLYISGIQLVRLDGTTYDVTGKSIFKVFETETYVISDVPVGNYKTVKFKVGLDAATNLLNPSASADSAMLNRPEMWFGSTAQPNGYVFMNLQGKIDTTADMTGAPVSFVYKIGTSTNYVQVTLPDKNFTVLKDQEEYVHVLIDYNRLFSGIQLNVASNLMVTTTAANLTAPATTIANNIKSIFIYE